MTLFEQEYRRLFVLAVARCRLNGVAYSFRLGRDLGCRSFFRRIGHRRRFHGSLVGHFHSRNARQRLDLLNGHRLNVGRSLCRFCLRAFFAEQAAVLFRCRLFLNRRLLGGCGFFCKRRLIVKRNIYRAATGFFSLLGLLLLILLGSRLGNGGSRLCLFLRLFGRLCAEELKKLFRRYAKRRQRKEYKRQQEHDSRAVYAERLFQRKGYERSENAGAKHFLAAGIESSEQLSDAAEVIDNDLRQQKIYKRACQKRQKQSRRHAPCARSFPVKCQNIRCKQKHRCTDPEAIAEKALQKRAQPADNNTVMRKYAYNDENGGKQKARSGYYSPGRVSRRLGTVRLFCRLRGLVFAGTIGFFLCSGLRHYSAYLPLSEYK